MNSLEVMFPSGDLPRQDRTGGVDPMVPRPELACLPVDAALARTVAEHVHCGEPMHLVTAADLPITAPLMVLAPGTVPPEPPASDTCIYRCACGFTLDARDPLA
ncbi:hypothetical protein D477_007024 [Arthrobacter crystallopoietes BAB-32]|uniref:Uncharacterized protein n=1 Tax=Arthrobacter crystallopoietes BAB-32 TaxID=1246476 RepID=N1V4J9_9MICC|nr:hypothetical protein [Arthrobacter crystallopoietes]EMY34939.1 hypothetical protein D477_007024 [Arthrobacter crystallopoietes BAB-32]